MENALNKIEKQYFAPANLQAAVAAIQSVIAIMATSQKEPRFTFDPQQDVPAGWGILIAPVQVKEGNEHVTVDCYVALVPSYELIAASGEQGQNYIKDSIESLVATHFQNRSRPKKDKAGNLVFPTQLPTELADWLEAGSREGAMAYYMSTAGAMLAKLAAAGIKIANPNILRQILASNEYAEQALPAKVAAQIDGLLKVWIDNAAKAGKNPGSLSTWLATRHQTSLVAVADDASLDLDSLAALAE